ncbi:MAG: hypothetical protein HY319_32775 [Armatimonadetes bacterium]|nr:hypothetical protein [Armatimonadota bacterium]
MSVKSAPAKKTESKPASNNKPAAKKPSENKPSSPSKPAESGSSASKEQQSTRSEAPDKVKLSSESTRSESDTESHKTHLSALSENLSEPERNGTASDTTRAGSASSATETPNSEARPSGVRTLTENPSADGKNCIDQAAANAQEGDRALFLADSQNRDQNGAGHVVLQRGESIVDPTHSRTYNDFQEFVKANPQYEQVLGQASGEQLQQIVQAQTPQEREQALRQAGLEGIQNVPFADGSDLHTRTSAIFAGRAKDAQGEYFNYGPNGQVSWVNGEALSPEHYQTLVEASRTTRDGQAVQFGPKHADLPLEQRIAAEDGKAMEMAARGQGMLDTDQARAVGGARLSQATAYRDAQNRLDQTAAREKELMARHGRFEAEYGNFLDPAQRELASRATSTGTDYQTNQANMERAAGDYASVLNNPLFQKEFQNGFTETEQARVVNTVNHVLPSTSAGQGVVDDYIRGMAADGSGEASNNVYTQATRTLFEKARSGEIKFSKDVLVNGVAATVGGALMNGHPRATDALRGVSRYLGLSGDTIENTAGAIQALRGAQTVDQLIDAQNAFDRHLAGIKGSDRLGMASRILTTAGLGASLGGAVSRNFGQDPMSDAAFLTTLTKDGGDTAREGLGLLARRLGEGSKVARINGVAGPWLGRAMPVLGAIGSALNLAQDLGQQRYVSAIGDFLTGAGYVTTAAAGLSGVGAIAGLGLIAVGSATKLVGDSMQDREYQQYAGRALHQAFSGDQGRVRAMQSFDLGRLHELSQHHRLSDDQGFERAYQAYLDYIRHGSQLSPEGWFSQFGADAMAGNAVPAPSRAPQPVR